MNFFFILAISCLSLIACTNCPNLTLADTVYTNGKIYTVNEAQPWAEAVALKDGAFVAVGSNADVESMVGSDTKVVDLKGKFALPGFHDLHVHVDQAYVKPMLGDALLSFPGEETSIEALQALLKAHSDKNPDLPILFATGLEISLFPNNQPTKAFIEEVVADRPVVLITATEHEGLLNSKAMEMEGITADTESPDGGTVHKDPKTGEPTGFVAETAAGKWAWKHYPAVEGEKAKKGL